MSAFNQETAQPCASKSPKPFGGFVGGYSKNRTTMRVITADTVFGDFEMGKNANV